MLGKYFPIAIGINADAATATNQIYNEIKKQKVKLNIKNWTTTLLYSIYQYHDLIKNLGYDFTKDVYFDLNFYILFT